jgi:hypothetical protein
VLDVCKGSTGTPAWRTGDGRRADPVLARVRAAHAPFWSL